MKKTEFTCIGLIVFIDMLSKAWSESSIGLGNSIPVIENFFYLTIVRNTGAAWSLLEGKMIFFYIVSVIALVIMFIALIKTSHDNRLFRYSMCFMVGGTLGNFIDRILFQYVRDFLDFVIFGYDFPVFNVADMALCFGVFLLIVDCLFTKEGEKKNG